jgi:hypothetical protein
LNFSDAKKKMDKFGEMPSTKVLLPSLVERSRHQHIRPADAEISSSFTLSDQLVWTHKIDDFLMMVMYNPRYGPGRGVQYILASSLSFVSSQLTVGYFG